MANEQEAPTKRLWSEIYGAMTATAQTIVDIVLLLWGTKTSLCLVGEAGIGKTQVLKQAAAKYREQNNIPEEDFGFLYVVLAHKDREHVTGLYYFSKDGKTFHSMHSAEVVQELSKPYGMYFVDEFNRPRDPSLLNAFFAMLSERGANGLYLKDGWTICSAINPSSAEYMVSQVERDPAFRRRLCWVEMVFNRAEWMGWASASGKIHPEVLSYLTNNPERVYDKVLQDSGKIGPTPAGWEDISEVITANEARKNVIGNGPLLVAVAGKIGDNDASQFISTYTRQIPGEKLPTALEIVSRYTEDQVLRKLIKSKMKKEGIGAKKTADLEGEGGGDDKGWLFKVMESVVLTTINTPYDTILKEVGIDHLELDGRTPAAIQKMAVDLVAKNVAFFLADLPPELFSTYTSLWGEVSTKGGDRAHERALEISMCFRNYPEFVRAAQSVRANIRKTQTA